MLSCHCNHNLPINERVGFRIENTHVNFAKPSQVGKPGRWVSSPFLLFHLHNVMSSPFWDKLRQNFRKSEYVTALVPINDFKAERFRISRPCTACSECAAAFFRFVDGSPAQALTAAVTIGLVFPLHGDIAAGTEEVFAFRAEAAWVKDILLDRHRATVSS